MQPRNRIFRPRWFVGNKIKKPMILCARSTSRSREQSTKRRSRSENMQKVCLFSNENNKSCDYQTWQTHLLRNSRGAQRYVGFFLLLIVFVGCWLASTHIWSSCRDIYKLNSWRHERMLQPCRGLRIEDYDELNVNCQQMNFLSVTNCMLLAWCKIHEGYLSRAIV